jgi:hypothetical protein
MTARRALGAMARRLCLVFLGSVALTLPLPAAAQGPMGIDGPYVGYGEGDNGKTQMTTLGAWSDFNEYTTGRVGIAYVKGKDRGDTIGFDFAISLSRAWMALRPYVGYGLLLAYNYDDNRPLAALYPEIGMRISLGQALNLSLFAKYFVTSEGGNDHFPIIGARLAFSLP